MLLIWIHSNHVEEQFAVIWQRIWILIENVFCGAANMRRMMKIKFGTMVPSESLIISLRDLGGDCGGKGKYGEINRT